MFDSKENYKFEQGVKGLMNLSTIIGTFLRPTFTKRFFAIIFIWQNCVLNHLQRSQLF